MEDTFNLKTENYLTGLRNYLQEFLAHTEKQITSGHHKTIPAPMWVDEVPTEKMNTLDCVVG